MKLMKLSNLPGRLANFYGRLLIRQVSTYLPPQNHSQVAIAEELKVFLINRYDNHFLLLKKVFRQLKIVFEDSLSSKNARISMAIRQ